MTQSEYSQLHSSEKLSVALARNSVETLKRDGSKKPQRGPDLRTQWLAYHNRSLLFQQTEASLNQY